MKTVILRNRRYIVMPEVSRTSPCKGCGIRYPSGECNIRLDDVAEDLKCGMDTIIYVERTREAVRQYRIDRLVGRLEDA